MKTNFNFETRPLAELDPGDEGVVAAVDDADALGRRLLDLGLLPDTPIRVVRRAPLGDPIELSLRGYHLCLRRADAARVLVRAGGAA